MWPQVPPPHFGPASLDFHLNRPVLSLIQLQNTVLSLIQLHIVAPVPTAGIVAPIAPIWLVPEPPLVVTQHYLEKYYPLAFEC